MKITAIEKKESSRIALQTDEGRLELYGIEPNIIRCTYTKRGETGDVSLSPPKRGDRDTSPVSPRDTSPVSSLQLEETAGFVQISAGELSVRIGRETGLFTWTEAGSGRLLFEEGPKELTDTPVFVYTTGDEEPVIRRVKTVDGERNFVENLRPVTDHMAYRARLRFRWQDGEQIHGLGQGEEGIYNYRGHVQYLYQHNMRIPAPWILSDRGYAVFVDCGSLMTFNDDERGSYLFLDNVEQLDYYVIAGPDVKTLIRGMRRLTVKAVMLPRWAFGYIQSKERYATQEEMTAVAQEYRRRGIGLDCVVQDWKTWKDDDWGDKRVDKSRYPDLSEMNRRLHELHVHSMVSVWPNMNFDTGDCAEMREAGFLLHDLATYDAFNEKARALYWKQAERELFSGGFDSWWCDSTEPFSGPDWGGETRREPWERYNLVGEEHKKFLGAQKANLYALHHARGIYENQRQACPGKRVLNLTRSGYPGIQQYGTVLWSGDISASWQTMRTQVTEGLNMALSGLPYWTLDIGGFFVVNKNWQKRGCGCNQDPSMKWFWHGDFEEGLEDPGYRELYVRWIQMGAFLPIFRSHGTDVPREIWQFGEPGEVWYDAIAQAIRLRYRLIPYIYSLAAEVVWEDTVMMRPLLAEFPEDERAASEDQSFLLGKDLLICPVTQPMYYAPGGKSLDVPKTWKVYLPENEGGWYDFHTGESLEGGREITVEAPIGRIPVFVRAGAILPMEEELQYADQVPGSPLQIRIYPGADGRFVYYEDEGDGYRYEEGVCNRIGMRWDDKKRTLTVGESACRIERGLAGRDITVICGEWQKTVRYDGHEMTVKVFS